MVSLSNHDHPESMRAYQERPTYAYSVFAMLTAIAWVSGF